MTTIPTKRKSTKPSHHRHRRKLIPVTTQATRKKAAASATSTVPIPARFKKSSQETARLIRRFHVLNKELAKCRAAGDTARETDICAEMQEMGGLDWYQKASTLGQNPSLTEIPLSRHQDILPFRLLDVGALLPTNYAAYSSWIRATPIDLNPQHPEIRKQDFLKMAPPAGDGERFDVVCLSLVVNFVGDPVDRGEMLRHPRSFLHPSTVITPRPSPRLLYLVLPLPCVTNSRYMSHEHLLAMMRSLGYVRCIRHHHSTKLAYYLFEWSGAAGSGRGIEWRKKVLEGREGGGRNNFCVVVKSD
ncbi:nucleolus protein [Jimgerdemannia flammicorona]|uniref:25S rRNA adenine-N(1) methyltransferase n=1 Tax=Jimgerdemannia flammicorona TaxID=994334 RepID=A0A433CC65_9FUNG|nr:nucleolus protein [Jimgerdemannia flammicorona]